MSSKSSKPSVRDLWAQYHISHALKRTYNRGKDQFLSPGHKLPPAPALQIPASKIPAPAEGDEAPKVCIIGAGAAGLFTAMLFDYLNANSGIDGFHIDYDIFEAAAENDPARGTLEKNGIGGRLFTYNFSNEPHDYYDVGAMRFPENPVMLRTFSLFGMLNMQRALKPDPNAPIGSLIPYYMSGNAEPWRFNDINATGSYESIATNAKPSYDPFQLSSDPANPISDDVLTYAATYGTDGVVNHVMQDYIKKLQTEDPETAFEYLMTQDKFSTNEFLGLTPKTPTPPVSCPFNYNTIEFLETFNGGTSWYDQANSETILEFLDFEADNWFCVMGGAQQLAINMAATLENGQIQFGSKVKGIDVSVSNAAQILLQGQTKYQGAYAGVFNSTTLGAMQQMDLTKANLNYGQRQAIRSLGYGASSKVGMKFSDPWWITLFGINKGGLGHSDLYLTDLRDAQRIATLVGNGDESELKERILRDLAAMHANHANKPMSEEEVYEIIAPKCLEMFAHDWYHDANTFGAFAFFRPNQFGSMWPYIIQSTPSLAIIGEHASPHHAWVVGALEAAVSSVYQWLLMNGYHNVAQVMKGWGPEPIMPTPDPNTGYVDPSKCNPFAGIPFWTSDEQRQWQASFGIFHEKNFQANHARKHHKGK